MPTCPRNFAKLANQIMYNFHSLWLLNDVWVLQVLLDHMVNSIYMCVYFGPFINYYKVGEEATLFLETNTKKDSKIKDTFTQYLYVHLWGSTTLMNTKFQSFKDPKDKYPVVVRAKT